jgi:hypothetical protein
MDVKGAKARIGTLQLCVLVFLLLFLLLCGVHLFVLHHAGDAHEIELASSIGLALAAIVTVALTHRRHFIKVSPWCSLCGDIAVILRTITAPTLETFSPIRI